MKIPTSRPRARRQAWLAVAAASLLAVVAACGSSASSDSSGSDSSDAPKPGTDKTVIAFVRTSSDTYQAAWQRGVKEVLSEQGYDVKFVENNADQAEQNSQVQQQVGTNKSPAAWVWMPSDAAAGAASLKALHDTGLPVFQVNQLPTKNTEQFITAYAGVNDVINGEASGELVLKAKKQLEATGQIATGDDAKVAVVKFYPGFAATINRLKGFEDVTKGKGIEIVASADDAVDATTGYQAALSIIPVIKSKGVNIVYAQNDASASGVIRALTESGFTPGKDVLVVGGNCRDDVSDLTSGRQFGTGLQAAQLEGTFSAQMLVNYFANPAIKAGEYSAPATPDALPEWPKEISKFNYLPNPPITADEVEDAKLWGQSMVDLCSY
ncbi:hypothetical protein C6I20_02990 [Aeromicrobium sp. A1-2]|uniref:sugar ABC transporter substrate-binding protein n=1 Tax=Aeromicrobium sp. A1-2 TaxID=2107713 RepID=UPI000E48921D|nr:sugar ABC transporter substrate-binding protein [Aeromicrobium sp. A1-2]AXT84258.1 hypothetical protein C6I20_02990 [Aeromicrobium sp. A1-2]